MNQERIGCKTAYFWSNRLFLLILGLYLLYQNLQITKFRMSLPWGLSNAFLYVFTGLAVVRLVLMLSANKADRPYLTRMVLGSLLVALVWLLVYRRDGYSFLLFLAVLTVGCVGLDYRTVCKLYAAVMGLSLLTAMLCALGGAISNLVYLSPPRLRSCWGIGYMTDFASCLVFICIFAWAGWRETSDLLFLIPAVLTLLIAHDIADSNTSVFCSVLLIFLLFFHWLFQKGYLPHLRRIADLISCAAFPLFGGIAILLTWAYHHGFAYTSKLNILSHHRLALASRAYDAHGLTLFGTPFDQIGAGGSLIARPDYNFVDCSYLLILLRYGVVTFLVVGLLWVLMTRAAIRHGHRRLAYALALIAFHSLSEHHFPEVDYNILLVLPFAVFPTLRRQSEGEDAPNMRRPASVRAVLIVCAAALILCLLFGPALLSWFRTLCGLLGMADAGRIRNRLLFAAVYLGWALVFLFFAAAARILTSLFRHEKVARGPLLVCVAGLCTAAVGCIGVDLVFRHVQGAYTDMLESDRNAIEILQAAEEPHIHVETMPALYARAFGGIDSHLYTGEDLARLKNVSLITDIDNDYNVLINCGFLYSPISADHAVYTNSAAAADALRQAGYHLTGYYSTPTQVDLADLARRNGLDPAEEGGYYLTAASPLRSGPGLTLYASPYTVSFGLQILASPADSSEEDPILGTVQITTRWGENALLEEEVRLSQSDAAGFLPLSVVCSIPAAEGVEFCFLPAPDTAFILEGVSYQKTPAYDTHAVYDSKFNVIYESFFDCSGNPFTIIQGYQARSRLYDKSNRIISECYYDEIGAHCTNDLGYSEVRRSYNGNETSREEYYGVNGEPVLCREGYFSVENEYDGKGNVIVQRFFGTNGKPVLIASGCAEKHRKFNEHRQISREEYYGTTGNLILLPAGYAAIEREYDDVGNLTVQRFYDTDNTPVLTVYGYAEVRRIFNDQKQIVREENYGTDGKPLLLSSGYFATERDYDNAGNLTVQRFYDADNTPVLTASGYAELRRSFNWQGQVVREEYYGTDGLPIAIPAGYAATEREYDDAGNLTAQRFYDAKGALTITTLGYAEVRRIFNNQKQIVREENYGTDGKPLVLSSGYFATEREYDDAGNLTVQRFYDADNTPVLTASGYAELRRSFNWQGQVVREEYYGTNKQSIAIPAGYAATEREYDDAGNLAIQRFYDTKGALTITTLGYAEVRRIFNDQKQIVREENYGTDGTPLLLSSGYFATEREYDDAGNLTVQRYYDLDNAPVLTTSGYAELHRVFNDQKQIVREEYYGTDGLPITIPAGYAAVERSYDESGALISETYYDVYGDVLVPAAA